MRHILLVVIALIYNNVYQAQDTLSRFLPVTKSKNYKYHSIQSNLLLQQFISFNSNSSINTNPYIYSYSRNNAKTGRGFVFGTGFSVSENSTNDGVADVTVQNANITMRMGAEKKYLQGERFVPFTGMDYAIGFIYNNVSSRFNQSVNATRTVVETRKFFMGPAFRGGLLCALSKNILIGTEFFFNFQLAFTQVNTNGNFGNSQSIAPLNIGFQAPTALFLVFRY